MPNRSDDPLRKVTLNLYEADCLWLEQIYGRGWTERIRQHIHNEVVKRQPTPKPNRPMTLGDLDI
jgi:hypothetical protein